MYVLLSPASRAALTADSFSARYQTALRTGTVLTASATLQALLVEGERAQAACRLAWGTALVGTVVTDTVLPLVLEGERWWVEGMEELIWPGLGAGNYLYMEHSVPLRANIYDRNSLALAAPGTIVTVGVVPGQVQDEQTLLSALNWVTGLPAEEIRERYAGRPADWWTPIADIPAEVGVQYADLLLNTPGIEAREKEGRTYLEGGAAAHVVGWVSPVPAEELEAYRAQGYRGDEWVGVSGLEGWGEAYLAGRHGGNLYLMGPSGEVLSLIAHRERVPSRAIYTTIDRDLQLQVQQILGDRRGAIVVLDVHSGAILALASGPSFNPNIFVGPGSIAEISAVLANPDQPLFNRATQGAYPCGSIFKIVTIAAALEVGGLTADTPFWCPGYWDGLGSNYRKFCWKEDGHGDIILRDALSASCNVTFYTVGQMLDGIDPNALPEFGRGFGLGVPLNVVGLVEEAPPMPDPEWKMENGQVWYVGDSVNLAIGQGDLRVTPLQVARMVAAVANGGLLYRPYVVERIGSAGEAYPEVVFEPEVVGTLPISAENLAVIQAGMLGTTTSPVGTATTRFWGMSIPVAGKTGSAEAGGEDTEPHSWFAAYVPADDPEIALVVMVENGGEGSRVAAPMGRQVIEAFYGLPLTPLPPEPGPTPTPAGPGPQ